MPSANEAAVLALRGVLEVAAGAVVLPGGIAGQPVVIHDEPQPKDFPAAGLIEMVSGDPGTPEVTLSPPTYHYEHVVPVEVTLEHETEAVRRQAVDAILVEIQTQIDADDTLGGAVELAETRAPDKSAEFDEGVTPYTSAEFVVTLEYETSSPLS